VWQEFSSQYSLHWPAHLFSYLLDAALRRDQLVQGRLKPLQLFLSRLDMSAFDEGEPRPIHIGFESE
jgi:hypothetical protein